MQCRVCKTEKFDEVINLGEQYLSDFRSDDKKPNKYPLRVLKCQECHFVQLETSAPFSEMYTENYGFKSGVNDTIKADLKDIVDHARRYYSHPLGRVLDVGSNDGTLLLNYPMSLFRTGIDPIKKLCDEAKESGLDHIVNDFFSVEALEKSGAGKFHIITAISMFYDVEDPDAFVRDMASLLYDDGVIIIQQNYILATLQNNAYDNICHEHIGYHSLLSMDYLFEKNGLECVDVTTSMVNGGVLRTVVQKKGVGTPTPAVKKQRQIEKEYGLDTMKPYINFKEKVVRVTELLKDKIAEIKRLGKKCYIYGASTRGGTIWQYAGLDVEDFPFAVDRNPGKVGKKIAAIGVPIISEEQAREDAPEYMLVSIWFFKEEIIKREKEYLANGGVLLFPLPELESVCITSTIYK